VKTQNTRGTKYIHTTKCYQICVCMLCEYIIYITIS